MRRALVNLLTAALVGLAILPLAASPAAAACAQENVVLYEDANSSGDAIQRCLNEPNLDQVAHVQAGLCNSQFIRLSDTWNDCVSSIRVTLPAGRCLRLYQHANYVQALAMPAVSGPRAAFLINLGGGLNDVLSSFRFYNKVNGLC